MKHGYTLFLKIVLLLIAVVIISALIRFPLGEGRAAHLDVVSVYKDPLILYIFVASIPFFYGLYQAFRLLTLIDADKAFSRQAIHTLRNIKFASLCLIGCILIALLYIRYFAQGDDPAGPTGLGILVSVGITVIATTAAIFQKLLQHAVDLQSENDLTV